MRSDEVQSGMGIEYPRQCGADGVRRWESTSEGWFIGID
jgi:hypothetical protein